MKHDGSSSSSVRLMTPDDRALALAAPFVIDRVMRMSKPELNDLAELLEELATASSDEDKAGIGETMLEILVPAPAALTRADLTSEEPPPPKLARWTAHISTVLCEARKQAGLTQEQLAARSGLPQSHISRIENARLSPSHTTLEKLASALGKPISCFDMPPEPPR